MSIIATKPLPGTTKDPLYPDSDGEPMGETGFHVAAIVHLLDALTLYFRDRDDVYVAADMFMYYEKGNPLACKAPDVMVSTGVAGNHHRRSFRTWEEGVAPTVIFEITSQKTRQEDLVAKPKVYAELGVKEYFRFDPENDGSEPALAGFRLEGGVYQPLKLGATGRLTSQELGLMLEAELPLLRLIDLRTGMRLLTFEEQAAQVGDQAQRLQELVGRLDQHAMQINEQSARIDEQALRLDEQALQIDAARRSVDAERARADAERQRAAELEAELALLRAVQNRPQPPA